MALKKRTYIQYTNAALNGTINLQTAYNATKTGDEKLSDGTVSGLATFGEIVFHHNHDVFVTLDSGEVNDEILFSVRGGAIDEHRLPGGKNITFRTTSNTNLRVYATVRQQPGASTEQLQTIFLE